MKYSDPQQFLAALDEQLRARAEQRGRIQDYENLRIELAIERFLARIGPDIAAVKGGTAAMLIVSNAPHTRDVDLVLTASIVQSLGLSAMAPELRAETIGELIQDHLRKGQTGDFFRFKYEDSFAITDLKPGHACVRINFSVMVARRDMHLLQVDIALQEGFLPTNMKNGKNLLGFADIANPQVRTVTAEFLFADKVTLFLEEFGLPHADRVKDIVHAALIAENCTLDSDELAKVLADRAVHRNVMGMLLKQIPDPPETWTDRFEELAEQAQSNMSMRQAIVLIRNCVDQVRDKVGAIAREGLP